MKLTTLTRFAIFASALVFQADGKLYGPLFITLCKNFYKAKIQSVVRIVAARKTSKISLTISHKMPNEKFQTNTVVVVVVVVGSRQ